MEIAFLVIGAVLLMVTAILSQTLTGKWKIFLWIVFTILLIVYTIVGINMELDRKVEKGKEDTNVSDLTKTNKQILDINKKLLNIVESPNFAKSPETLSKIDEIKSNLSLIGNKSKSILRFSFWSDRDIFIDTLTAPVENGIVTIKFSAKNISTVQANKGKIWIQICNGCKFAEEPQGSETTDDVVVRRKPFESLYAGVYFEPTVLKIIPPQEVDHFTIAFKYACENCPPIDNEHPQKLRVNY